MDTRKVLVATLIATMAALMAMPDASHAQQQRRGLFEMLFGPRFLQPGPPPPRRFLQPPPEQVPRSQRRRSRAPAEPAAPAVEVVEKAPDARKILVVGDFVAGGLAWGLDQMFAEEPKLAVVERSNGSSGLVRDDYYDWNGELLGILNEEKPDIVVVALGSNDRQQIRTATGRLAPRSEPWQQEYVARIRTMAETLKVYGRPFFWMGAPPMRQSSALRDMAYLNELYPPPVTAAGGHFVDIWGGFTNEEGKYISSGPDVEGQLRGLRSGDGINFTRAGRLKLAFYVEREIRRQTGIGAGAVDLLASTDQQSQIEVGPDGVKRLVGPVISLSDPLPGASNALVGGPDQLPPPATEEETPQELMIVKGAALPVVGGRADDFTWPPKPRSAPAAPGAEASEPVANSVPVAN
jgi:uncharacterized protein